MPYQCRDLMLQKTTRSMVARSPAVIRFHMSKMVMYEPTPKILYYLLLVNGE